VLDAAGVQTMVADEAGCCGAIREHLADHGGALADMKRNVDAWWPLIERGEVEAIVMNASGCGVMVKDYGHALAHDPAYAERARRISEATRDVSELLPSLMGPLQQALRARAVAVDGEAFRPLGRVAYHPPCTLQHGQQLRGGVEALLGELGFDVSVAASESHLCCGSAGTYSVLQPALSQALRDRKLAHLQPLQAPVIASANIGCIQHLQSGTTTRVAHWVELVDEALHGA
jgi:glycolate oxidase iron-sulfur subunit